MQEKSVFLHCKTLPQVSEQSWFLFQHQSRNSTQNTISQSSFAFEAKYNFWSRIPESSMVIFYRNAKTTFCLVAWIQTTAES